MRRMPCTIGLIDEKPFRDRQPFSNADDEQSRPRLRHEPSRVHDQPAKAIPFAGNRRSYGREVLTVMRSESAANIFEDDDRRRPALFAELLDEAPEGPESPRTFALQSGPGARERQI